MSSETFTIDQVKLLEDSVLCMSKESSRKLQDSDRIPLQSQIVKSQIEESKAALNKQLDDLALIRAKLITLRHFILNETTTNTEEPITE
jgi:hypothetical protein